jgi:hypothetical protein
MFCLLIISIILCALLSRAGGQGQEETAKPKWMPLWLRHTWVRDWIIPIVIYSLCALAKGLDWLLLAAVLATGGALTTYWDEIFGFDNYWFSGFMAGLGAFPLYWAGYHWYTILARAFLLAVLWGGWCAIFKKDTTEEYARGAFIAATIPLLFI